MFQKSIKTILSCSMIVALAACGTKIENQAPFAEGATIISPYASMSNNAPLAGPASTPPNTVDGSGSWKQPNTRIITNANTSGKYKNGTFMVMPSPEITATNENYADARELKLKVRELASQLLADLPQSLASAVAVPTTFVDQDNFNKTSSFGRFISEQMFYEFNQRGVKTNEYRIGNTIKINQNGEFMLTRDARNMPLSSGVIYLVGTYFSDGSNVFVNGRLIQSNGRVIRAGQIIFPMNTVTYSMLGKQSANIQSTPISIQAVSASKAKTIQVDDSKISNTQSKELNMPTSHVPTPFDQGFDIH